MRDDRCSGGRGANPGPGQSRRRRLVRSSDELLGSPVHLLLLRRIQVPIIEGGESAVMVQSLDQGRFSTI